MDTNRHRSPDAVFAPLTEGGAERRVYYVFVGGDAAASRPLARFTDAFDAATAVTALEHIASRIRLLSRDESPDLPRPSFWRLEYASPANRRCATPIGPIRSSTVSR